MRAMRLHAQRPIGAHPLVAEDVAVPEPAADEVLLRVAACGICRTDLHVVEGDLPLRRAPVVPGHQIVGRVERVGPRASRFRPGDRVGVAWLRRTCGTCEDCRSGRENLCERSDYTGYSADGGFAEYATAPERFAYPIPPAFGDVEATPLLCAGIIGYRALALAAVPGGGRLGVYGFGSSAHVTVQVARARGCEIFVCTREASHRALARRLGAAWTGELGDRMPAPADGIIVFAPAGDLVPLALRNLRKGGTLSLAGIYMSTIPALEYRDLFYERTIRTVTSNTRADGEALLAEASRIPVRVTTTAFALDQANEALEGLKRGAFAGSGVLLVDSRACADIGLDSPR
jgi:propanol-preferring alcohol dehydrogenase